MAIHTLGDLYLHLVNNHRKGELLKAKRDGTFQPIPTEEFETKVRRVMAGLLAVGIGPGDRVAILSENRPAWPIVDFAVQLLRAVVVPLYPNFAAPDVQYILEHSGSRVLFMSQPEHVDILLEAKGKLPQLKTLVCLPRCTPGEDMVSWQDFQDNGDSYAEEMAASADYAERIEKEDLASIVYTSGTTADPKGVMLTHRNLAHNVQISLMRFSILGSDIALSFLPLSHVYERIVDYTYLMTGATICYAERLDPQVLIQNIKEIRPTIMASVPRLYEKMYSGVMAKLHEATGLKGWLGRSGVAVAKAWGAKQDDGKNKAGFWLNLKHSMFEKLIYPKLRTALFGGRIRVCMSGGAPLAKHLAAFFWGIGVPVMEGYGLTETSPVISCNSVEEFRFGSVGRPLASVDVRVAEDGEIQTRSDCVMRGYFQMEEQTKKVIDEDGWFSTGDIGHLDEDGYIFITDRKKEILVTASGKNVAPQPIETDLKRHRAVCNAIVVGDNRPFIGVLLVPDPEYLDEHRKEHGLEDMPTEQLIHHPTMHKMMKSVLEEVNQNLSGYAQMKRYAMAARDFSIDQEELTPTLKLKRRKILEHFADEIATIYPEA